MARAATAKQLIGFANRDFVQSARHAEGHAYLLLGVEPQNLVGVPRWDSADVEKWLVRFVGPELRYDIAYVELAGENVLFLTVDPPRQGDPPFYRHKVSGQPGGGGDALPEGAIYVRHGGHTDAASGADIARLTARARAVASKLSLSVDLDTSRVAIIGPVGLSNAARDAYVESERKRLYDSMPRTDSGEPWGSVAFSMERRTRDEFMLEVEAYANLVSGKWPAIVVADHVENERSQLVPVLINDTEENFEDVVLELTFPVGPNLIYARPGEAASRLTLPEQPDRWGTSLSRLMGPLPTVPIQRPPQPVFEKLDEATTLVRFPPALVRPHSREQLPRVLLALPPRLADETLQVHWRVTARNTKGHLQGGVEFVVPGPPCWNSPSWTRPFDRGRGVQGVSHHALERNADKTIETMLLFHLRWKL